MAIRKFEQRVIAGELPALQLQRDVGAPGDLGAFGAHPYLVAPQHAGTTGGQDPEVFAQRLRITDTEAAPPGQGCGQRGQEHARSKRGAHACKVGPRSDHGDFLQIFNIEV
ncbi:hypothetical protein DL240_00115 [Lujinxingia litoralis]|uniref:Uncharacterized protein n=1 Tax=Lujinxingia litoralis TaxID=2211119 RepID=A0A328CCV3_9DELT|nr:hypothetical protein DL240_00115 [Lujinxingia litoralis]